MTILPTDAENVLRQMIAILANVHFHTVYRLKIRTINGVKVYIVQNS